MPIKPQEGEGEKEFISRCISTEVKAGREQEQAAAICYSSWRKEHPGAEPKTELEVLLEGVGPTILGAAVTNRPHIKPLPPIEVVGEDGQERLLVPLLREGKFRHSTGLLDFNRGYFDRMVGNFKSKVVGTDISLDNRHKPELGAVGWFEDVFVDADGLLKARVNPTPTGLQSIKDRQYRYASVEFHRDWEHPEIVYNSDELENYMEEDMAISLEEYQKEVEAREKLEAQIKSLEEQYDGKIKGLEESYADTIARLEAQAVQQHVESIVLRAENYRSEGNMGHPKTLLDWAKSVLMLEDLGEGVVTLESRDNPKNLRAYVRKAVSLLLETLPGTVPFSDTTTERDNERKLETGESEEVLAEAAKSFWEM